MQPTHSISHTNQRGPIQPPTSKLNKTWPKRFNSQQDLQNHFLSSLQDAFHLPNDTIADATTFFFSRLSCPRSKDSSITYLTEDEHFKFITDITFLTHEFLPNCTVYQTLKSFIAIFKRQEISKKPGTDQKLTHFLKTLFSDLQKKPYLLSCFYHLVTLPAVGLDEEAYPCKCGFLLFKPRLDFASPQFLNRSTDWPDNNPTLESHPKILRYFSVLFFHKQNNNDLTCQIAKWFIAILELIHVLYTTEQLSIQAATLLAQCIASHYTVKSILSDISTSIRYLKKVAALYIDNPLYHETITPTPTPVTPHFYDFHILRSNDLYRLSLPIHNDLLEASPNETASVQHFIQVRKCLAQTAQLIITKTHCETFAAYALLRSIYTSYGKQPFEILCCKINEAASLFIDIVEACPILLQAISHEDACYHILHNFNIFFTLSYLDPQQRLTRTLLTNFLQFTHDLYKMLQCQPQEAFRMAFQLLQSIKRQLSNTPEAIASMIQIISVIQSGFHLQWTLLSPSQHRIAICNMKLFTEMIHRYHEYLLATYVKSQNGITQELYLSKLTIVFSTLQSLIEENTYSIPGALKAITCLLEHEVFFFDPVSNINAASLTATLLHPLPLSLSSTTLKNCLNPVFVSRIFQTHGCFRWLPVHERIRSVIEKLNVITHQLKCSYDTAVILLNKTTRKTTLFDNPDNVIKEALNRIQDTLKILNLEELHLATSFTTGLPWLYKTLSADRSSSIDRSNCSEACTLHGITYLKTVQKYAGSDISEIFSPLIVSMEYMIKTPTIHHKDHEIPDSQQKDIYEIADEALLNYIIKHPFIQASLPRRKLLKTLLIFTNQWLVTTFHAEEGNYPDRFFNAINQILSCASMALKYAFRAPEKALQWTIQTFQYIRPLGITIQQLGSIFAHLSQTIALYPLCMPFLPYIYSDRYYSNTPFSQKLDIVKSINAFLKHLEKYDALDSIFINQDAINLSFHYIYHHFDTTKEPTLEEYTTFSETLKKNIPHLFKKQKNINIFKEELNNINNINLNTTNKAANSTCQISLFHHPIDDAFLKCFLEKPIYDFLTSEVVGIDNPEEALRAMLKICGPVLYFMLNADPERKTIAKYPEVIHYFMELLIRSNSNKPFNLENLFISLVTTWKQIFAPLDTNASLLPLSLDYAKRGASLQNEILLRAIHRHYPKDTAKEAIYLEEIVNKETADNIAWT